MPELKPIAGTDYFLWKYLPSLPASIIFVFLFTTITAAHCWRMFRTKTWFCIPFFLGGLLQISGYATRIWALYNTDQIAPYAVSASFIFLPPVFYAASIYMVLGRLIRAVHAEHLSPVRTTWLTKLFVAGDLIALQVQASSSSLTTKTETQKAGVYLALGGLSLQMLIFGLFIVVAVIFHRRMIRGGGALGKEVPDVPWRQGLRMLYIVSGLIVFRSVFRIIEYALGFEAYLFTVEWPAYLFDALPMWIVQVVFFWWYPDQLVRREGPLVTDSHVMEPTSRSRGTSTQSSKNLWPSQA